MSRLKTYDPTAILLLINGLRIEGGGETAYIDFEAASPRASDAVSVTGEVVVNRNADRRVYATITVMETSVACRVLDQIMRAQAALPSYGPMPFLMIDPVSGDEIASSEAVFIESALPSKAKTAGERTFKLLLPQARDSVRLGTLNIT